MIKEIIELLEVDSFYGKSKNIDIAKGINKVPMTLKEGFEQLKRKKAWRI